MLKNLEKVIIQKMVRTVLKTFGTFSLRTDLSDRPVLTNGKWKTHQVYDFVCDMK